MRQRWLSRRAFLLHFLLVTIAPGCLFAGWWQVHRALSGNLVSYFYSIEWPIFAVLAGVAWWQLLHDEERPGLAAPARAEGEGQPRGRRSWWHGSEQAPVTPPPLRWDRSQESPELAAYNDYLRSLAAGGRKKTWRNPRGLPDAPVEAR
ncbi:MAG TPA: hypothetical protein VFN61_04280 [Acidimicrobiales bacterium]|nr:hypothetical protein [Acidimicrobiales bacterium]